jgi:hypothetical protein
MESLKVKITIQNLYKIAIYSGLMCLQQEIPYRNSSLPTYRTMRMNKIEDYLS